jgi:hypothetical protein
MPGPMPKRSEERTRRNKTGEDGLSVKKGVALPYQWQEPGEDWDPRIVTFYESFKDSGMQAYYQQTDVSVLWLACDLLSSQVMSSGRPSAMMLAECMKMLDGLGITEGERRRIKIELDTPQVQEVDAKVVAMESAKARLKKSAKE